MSRPRDNKRLAKQDDALADFFESLLNDVQAYADQEVTSAPPVAMSNKASPDTASAIPKRVPERNQDRAEAPPVEQRLDLRLFSPLPPVAQPVVATPVLPVEPPITTDTPAPNDNARLATEAEAQVGGRPAYASGSFQVLLFKVSGLTLAVPLVELSGVLEWRAEAVTAMPGHADFYLGLLPHLGQKVALIDAARLVLPPDKLQHMAGGADPSNRIKRIVLIQEGRYGLACDSVDEVISLDPNDVRWRTSRTQRRWLAGTVVEHMCALIDASAFADMLEKRSSIKDFRDSGG